MTFAKIPGKIGKAAFIELSNGYKIAYLKKRDLARIADCRCPNHDGQGVNYDEPTDRRRQPTQRPSRGGSLAQTPWAANPVWKLAHDVRHWRPESPSSKPQLKRVLKTGQMRALRAFPPCHASNSRRFALFRGDGGKVGNCALHRRVDTGWIKPHTLTGAYPWSLPTSGAGRFCVRRMSR